MDLNDPGARPRWSSATRRAACQPLRGCPGQPLQRPVEEALDPVVELLGGPGLPVSTAAAVALRQTPRMLLAVGSTGQRGGLQLHQPPGGKADQLAQQVGVRSLLDQSPQARHFVGQGAVLGGRSAAVPAGPDRCRRHRWSPGRVGVAARSCRHPRRQPRRRPLPPSHTTTRDTAREPLLPGSDVPLMGIRSCIFRVRRRSGSDVRGGNSFVHFS